jgi:NADH:ubiquinone oxidoreductase subunit E
MNEKTNIVICLGSSCYRRGNQQILEIVKDYLQENYLKSKVDFRGQLCSGNCAHGPVIKINGKMYKEIDEASVVKILDSYFKPEKVIAP